MLNLWYKYCWKTNCLSYLIKKCFFIYIAYITVTHSYHYWAVQHWEIICTNCKLQFLYFHKQLLQELQHLLTIFLFFRGFRSKPLYFLVVIFIKQKSKERRYHNLYRHNYSIMFRRILRSSFQLLRINTFCLFSYKTLNPEQKIKINNN